MVIQTFLSCLIHPHGPTLNRGRDDEGIDLDLVVAMKWRADVVVEQLQTQVGEKIRVLALEVVDFQVSVGPDQDQVARRCSLDSVDKFEDIFEPLGFFSNLVRTMIRDKLCQKNV